MSTKSMNQGRLLRHLPKDERRRLILSDQTAAGPLAVLMYKYPIRFWIVTILTVSIIFTSLAWLVNKN